MSWLTWDLVVIALILIGALAFPLWLFIQVAKADAECRRMERDEDNKVKRWPNPPKGYGRV